ncbi:MAG: amidohydrolase family protein [Oscillospiraceae bacterium]
MKLRFYNARILTIENDSFKIISGELCTENDIIEYIGSERKSDIQFDREINLDGNLIISGFKNAHSHSPMTFLRSYADDLPLHEWLYDRVFPMEAKLNPDYIYTFTKLAIMEYLTSGITSCFDMYCQPQAMADAAIDCGFRMVLCGEINDFVETPETIEDFYNKFNSYNPLVSYQLGFHAEYTTSKHILESVAELSRKYKAPVYMHNSETSAEVAGCIERYGTTPTVLFDSMGMFEYGGGGFHCVYMSDEDYEIFRKKGLWAVTNPASNLKLASGIAPLCEMMRRNIKLAIGTDGSASNNALDMFREMYLAAALQKIYEKDAAACPAENVLKMAVKGSADAIGLEYCNNLEVGKKADMAVIDMYSPNMNPINNIVSNLVYSGSKSNVKMTVVNGKILYENGEFFIGEDAERIYREANEMAEKIKNAPM